MSPWPDPAAGENLLITLYEHPRDLPEHYALRAWYVPHQLGAEPRPSPAAMIFDSARAAASWMLWHYPMLHWEARRDGDEAQILGVWF
jgi:hypothetical protein